MKYLLFFTPLLMAVLLNTGCGDDDDCLRSDFLGTYNGTSSCNDADNSSLSDVFIVTEGSAENLIIISDNAGSTLSATLSGCNFTLAQVTVVGVTFSGNGKLEGQNLSMTIDVDDGSDSFECTYSGSR